MAESIRLLVGTTKGAFILDADNARQDWTVSGPLCDGWPINHVIGDTGTGTLWAAGGGQWHGAGVWRSDDRGKSWTLSKIAGGQLDEWVRNDPEVGRYLGITEIVEAPFTGDVEALWSLGRAGNTLYTGGKPGMLFASHDNGTTWEKVEGICDHPDRENWQAGGAGLTLHTIVSDPADPQKLWVGISAAGLFASEDGGRSWELRNRRSNDDLPDAAHVHADGTRHDPATEVGGCVHNMVRAPGNGSDLLYQQNHHGTFRSSDGGRSWHEITKGLPSSFGFPIAVHPADPSTLWVIPMNSDTGGRYPPDASAKVWKSTDGGDSWAPKSDGLPDRNCFFTVLRQAMTTDRHPSAGVYFGTNSGSVFGSIDEGETWNELARHLPTVLSVEAI